VIGPLHSRKHNSLFSHTALCSYIVTDHRLVLVP
jgi:hypothetical protein